MTQQPEGQGAEQPAGQGKRPVGTVAKQQWLRWWPLAVAVLYSTVAGCYLMHVGSWDLSVPWNYPFPTYDEVWQLHLTKSVLDNGWILRNPYLGAPGIADWYVNAAPQTSGLHSVLLWLLGLFITDAVRVQQVYFLLNFPLIAAATYVAARVLRIGRVPAMVVGVLFAFLAYRFNLQLYAYLANYFCIPLALIPVYWIMLGRYANEADARTDGAWLRLLTGRKFLVGVACTVLVVLSDGYYAFFTLLLLGFAVGARLLSGDWRKPTRLLAPVALIVVLIGLASAMMLPLKQYERTHRDEFYPGGVADSTMAKHPYEAEVYSTSLKLLVTPYPVAHRVPLLADIGSKMLASTNDVHKFPREVAVPLGLLGSVLLFIAFALIAVKATGSGVVLGRGDGDGYLQRFILASMALAFFVFLCSIEGGLGALIAFVYPSIRAYSRFAVFLLLILYFGAGAAATAFIRGAVTGNGRKIRILLVLVVGVLAHLDQVPLNTWHGREDGRVRYVAERDFVQKVEASLPKGSMVYNYPYSQYLTDSPYYGWGAYGQIRLYMHSHDIRWSNGSGKNTAVERWHALQASQPTEQLLIEMAAVGFRGVVVDRMVVKDQEYATFKNAAAQVGAQLLIEDPASRLAFFTLPDPGYTIVYDSSFGEVDSLIVRDRAAFSADRVLAGEVRRQGALDVLAKHPGEGEVRLSRQESPAAFSPPPKPPLGLDTRAIDMAKLPGSLKCALDEHGNIALMLHNDSDAPWMLNSGDKPLTIGVNVLAGDDSVLIWDEGLRIRDRARLPSGEDLGLGFSMDTIKARALPVANGKPVFARFALLQDGNAWSNTINCKIQVTP